MALTISESRVFNILNESLMPKIQSGGKHAKTPNNRLANARAAHD